MDLSPELSVAAAESSGLTDEEIERVRSVADSIPPDLVSFSELAETGEAVAYRNAREMVQASAARSRRCSHVSSATERQCSRSAAIGLDTCKFHSRFGPATEMVREIVQDYTLQGLYDLAPDAIRIYERILTDDSVSAPVRLKAAADLFDRIGVRAGMDVTVDVNVTSDSPADLVRERLERLSVALPSGPASSTEDEIVEGEIVV